jgi:hypothetical protein
LFNAIEQDVSLMERGPPLSGSTEGANAQHVRESLR